MTYIALAIVTLGSHAALVAAFVLHTRAQARTVTDMGQMLEAERATWVGERRELLNRIKPETAQYAPPADGRQVSDPPQPRWDDDQQIWAASMSAEELAEALMAQERQMAEAAG